MASLNCNGLDWARFDNRDKLMQLIFQQRRHNTDLRHLSELHHQYFVEDETPTVVLIEEFTLAMLDRCGFMMSTPIQIMWRET